VSLADSILRLGRLELKGPQKIRPRKDLGTRLRIGLKSMAGLRVKEGSNVRVWLESIQNSKS
jgi:hypothetical protein